MADAEEVADADQNADARNNNAECVNDTPRVDRGVFSFESDRFF